MYLNYTGVGNTVNANHPLTQKLIVDCLRYWVEDMHVDGFRFDEGSILARGEDGLPLPHPPVIWQIELDEALAETKLIAEAWDAAGLYQVGHFPGDRWGEWNGQYRDDVRRFLRGDPGLAGAIAARLGGSADIYESRGQAPVNSINFVTVHDGFTLNDLVSYDHKHNDANGEGNRDGIDNNYSWNCGVEGPSGDVAIERLRVRQIKNACAILMLSRGVPMILSGDEVRRTQRGNNNAYNQDNATSWFDWTLVEKNAEVLRFFQRMIAFRKANGVLTRPRFYRGETNERGLVDIAWHGTKLFSPGFDDPEGRALACTIAGFGGAPDLHVMLNMYWQRLDFELPQSGGRGWRVAVNTFEESPQDLPDAGARVAVSERVFPMQGRSDRRAGQLLALFRPGDDEHVPICGLILVQRLHGRHAVRDPPIVEERGVERRCEREAAERAAVERVDGRRGAPDVDPIDQQHEHVVHAVAMDAFGRRLASLALARLDSKLVHLDVPAPAPRPPPA